MTHRTDHHMPSPVEKATADTEQSIVHNAKHFHGEHHAIEQMPENQFRRMLARYFHGQSLQDWYDLLGVNEVTHDHGGEGGSARLL